MYASSKERIWIWIAEAKHKYGQRTSREILYVANALPAVFRFHAGQQFSARNSARQIQLPHPKECLLPIGSQTTKQS